ncbi:2-dehydropantoate 2-reductase [Flavobacteriaceae bacterium]|nr:2-dehydropantoate 2-reductase [Flavobacteriaceae bacterium]
MNIVIYGSGGVGGYFGSRLLQAGNNVHFIARGAHLEALKNHGIHVYSILGDVHISDLRVSSSSSEIAFDQIDLVIFATKTYQLHEAAYEIKPYVKSNTTVLSLLNGISNASILSKVFGPEQVLGGLCRIISKIDSPGIIRHLDVKPNIVFGELDGTVTLRSEAIYEVFKSAGIKTQLTENIHREIWTKFMFISSISALGALVRAPIGILRVGYLRNLIINTAEEIKNLGELHGINFPENIILKQLEVIDKQDALTTASLQRDIMEGRTSELEAQNGEVVRLCKEKNISCPTNEMIYELLRPQELKNQNK